MHAGKGFPSPLKYNYVHALQNNLFKIDITAVENKQNLKYSVFLKAFVHHVDSNCENLPATVAL